MTLPSRTGRLFRAVTMAATTVLALALADVSLAAAAPPSGDILPAGTATTVPNSYVVVLKDSASLQQQGVDTTVRSLAGKYGGTVGHVYRRAVHGFEVSLSEAAAERLAADSAVKYMQRNGVYKISGIQTNPPSWGLDRIDQSGQPLDGSYTYPTTASTVHAYIIDTGIRLTHSDLGGRATAGIDAINAADGANDCNGHGTHVAGTVGGSSYGVAKGVQLVAVRVLDCDGSGTTAQVVAGIDWVTANAVKPAVANMSLGGVDNDITLNNAVTNSINSGVTYAIAAGNGDDNGNPLDACNVSPARVPAAITVGATDSSDDRAWFSNYGSCLDIFAPGVDITSAWNTDDTARNTINGTSMATPHVTGAAALVASANPSWTPQQIRDYLVGSATSGVVVDPGTGSPNKLLRVVNPAPADDFALSLSIPGAAVTAGNSVYATVYSSTTSGSAQTVTFSTSGLPAGTTASFSSPSITSGGSSVMHIQTTGSTPSGTYSVTVVGTGSSATHTALIKIAVSGGTGGVTDGTYVPVAANRILDTRSGEGAPVGKIGPHGVLPLQVTGRGGFPASGVSAVVLNVTATNATTGSYLTAYPTGVDRPTASNLNFPAGWTGANSVTVPVGPDGKINIYNELGYVDVLADTLGYYTKSGTSGGGLYHRLAPTRMIDTRTDWGRVQSGETLSLSIGMQNLVDSGKQIKAVAVNITAVTPDWFGYLTAYNPLGSVPTASTLNYSKGQVVPNFTIVQTAACPGSGEWSWCKGQAVFGVYNGSAATTDIIVDVVGFYDDGSVGKGFQFHPITPTRIADSRYGQGTSGKLGPASTTTFTTPTALHGNATWALMCNVTGIVPTKATYLSLWAASEPTPPVSNLNLVAGEIRPNAAVVDLDDYWDYNVYNAQGYVDVAIDASGVFDYVSTATVNAAGTSTRATSVEQYTATVKHAK